MPYVSDSYFPDIPVEPALQHRATIRVAAALPKGELFHVADLDYGFLDRTTCAATLQKHLMPVLRFAQNKTVDLYVCAPNRNPMFQDIADNVAAAVAEMVRSRGLKLRTVLYAGPGASTPRLNRSSN